MVKIISHRGLGFEHPENTLEAIKAACKSKVDYVEFDLRIYKEEYILLHNKYSTKKKVYLKEVLKHCKNKPIMVDVKDYGLEKKLLEMLKPYNFIIVSWNKKILYKIHKLNPKIKLSYSYRPKIRRLPKLPLHSVNIPWYLTTNKLIHKFHNKKIKVNIFTINLKRIYHRFQDKVDMVYTNKPKKLLRLLS
tara:strand:- start:47889 stop:48461 length:573 start_codon:yes stop_codon:yes gene_type:complete